MALFNLTEQQLNNLVVFLDRLEYKGLKEVQAINEIMSVLNSPEESQGRAQKQGQQLGKVIADE